MFASSENVMSGEKYTFSISRRTLSIIHGLITIILFLTSVTFATLYFVNQEQMTSRITLLAAGIDSLTEEKDKAQNDSLKATQEVTNASKRVADLARRDTQLLGKNKEVSTNLAIARQTLNEARKREIGANRKIQRLNVQIQFYCRELKREKELNVKYRHLIDNARKVIAGKDKRLANKDELLLAEREASKKQIDALTSHGYSPKPNLSSFDRSNTISPKTQDEDASHKLTFAENPTEEAVASESSRDSDKGYIVVSAIDENEQYVADTLVRVDSDTVIPFACKTYADGKIRIHCPIGKYHITVSKGDSKGELDVTVSPSNDPNSAPEVKVKLMSII